MTIKKTNNSNLLKYAATTAVASVVAVTGVSSANAEEILNNEPVVVNQAPADQTTEQPFVDSNNDSNVSEETGVNEVLTNPSDSDEQVHTPSEKVETPVEDEASETPGKDEVLLEQGTDIIQPTLTTSETNTAPSYSRDEAKKEQDFLEDVSVEEKDKFLESIVSNNAATSVTSKEELAQILDSKIKDHTGAIVIEEEGNLTNLSNGTTLVGTGLMDEVEKLGLSSGALVSGYSVHLVSSEDNKLTWVLTPYFEETNALADAREQFIDEVSTYVNANYSTNVEKLYAVYSYLGQTTLYNNDTSLPAGAPSSLILNNEAVCEAFAYLYNEIGTKLGLNMKYVTGTINDTKEGHAWNLVELDGKWYNTDATWGNIDRNGENSLEVNASYFLFSDEKANLSRQREHNTLPTATDTTYDALYNDNQDTSFGGGVYGDLIISPTDEKIVVFENIDKTSGYSFDKVTNDYQISKTMLLNGNLYVSYFDKLEQKFKVGYIDIANISNGVAINPLADAPSSSIQFGTNGITLPNGTVVSYLNGDEAITSTLNPQITVGNDHSFPLNSQYDAFLKGETGGGETGGGETGGGETGGETGGGETGGGETGGGETGGGETGGETGGGETGGGETGGGETGGGETGGETGGGETGGGETGGGETGGGETGGGETGGGETGGGETGGGETGGG
ncbi:transglutaminase domain-containing protein, partial [Lysinibacillus sp. NPDC096418]|uniref:transglutaminase domain-containing protein n=1 Tax=Lysinibacillus sp. NPDC096418 TaxID=3364138 RepID=UPI00381ECE6B